jgi:hypothetical protein
VFVSSNLVYLQMQKTGCTHIASVLGAWEQGKSRGRKHQPLTFDRAGRLVVSSVRNPWDWYVSLWAYGSMGKGAVFESLTRDHVRDAAAATVTFQPRRFVSSIRHYRATKGRRRGDWRPTYGDPYNPAMFRHWLRQILGESGRRDLGEGYNKSGVKTVCGFMTYRFLKLCTAHDAWKKTGIHLSNEDDLRSFVDDHFLCDSIIRTETLEDDLATVLQRLGHDATPDALRQSRRTNTSERMGYQAYYDRECRDLVAERDRLLIERFGYDF